MHARTELLSQGGYDVPVIKCINIYVYISQLMYDQDNTLNTLENIYLMARIFED